MIRLWIFILVHFFFCVQYDYRDILMIMIQNVSHIEKEFLLKSALQNEQPVRFHGVSTAGTGVIKTVEREALCITLLDTIDNACFSICERLTGYFDCHGKTYAFESTVRDSRDREVRIDVPSHLIRSLQRKFIRVRKPRDVQVLFRLPNEDINLSYPVCPEYISIDELDLSSDFRGKTLPEVIARFKRDIALRSSENTIIMFRTRKPSRFEEVLISETGKVLFIPSTSSTLPKVDPYPEGRIITEQTEETFEDPNFFVEGSHFEKLLVEKKNQGISSEIWCPVVYYQYVVGYIFISNRNGESFDITMVDYLWDFSRILAWYLKETGYFSEEAEPVKAPGHEPHILDMSPGGMLFSLPRTEIRTPIREGSAFSLDITTTKRSDPISCSARVIRRFEEPDSITYGTSFLNLSAQDMMSLYEILYRRPYQSGENIGFESS